MTEMQVTDNNNSVVVHRLGRGKMSHLKKIAVLVCALGLVFALGSCVKSGSGSANQSIKLVTNGRLSAIEPPQGWELKKAQLDDELTYTRKGKDDSDYDIYLAIQEGTIKDLIDTIKDYAAQDGKTIKVSTTTIGSHKYSYHDSDLGTGSKSYYTQLDPDNCLSIDVGTKVDTNSADFKAILGSVKFSAR